MDLKKEMFFDAHNKLDSQKVVDAIAANPAHGADVIDFIWDVMKDESEYEYEKKWLEMKYHHDMKELKEKYGMPLDDKE